MSAFTDEDLKRLNEYSYGHEIHMLDGGTFDLKALLARLEAAEASIPVLLDLTEIHDVPEYATSCRKGACLACKANEVFEAWLKASGRRKPAPICLNNCKGRCDNPTHDPFAY